MSRADLDAFYAAVGRQIHRLRNERGLTQEELGEAISLSRTSVTNIEGGRQKILVHTLVEVALALGVDVTELLPDFELVRERSAEERTLMDFDEVDRRFIEKLVDVRRDEEAE